MSMRQRLDLAKELVDAGKLDEATEEYTWLWEHMLEHETSLYGVRISFMINDMKNLAQRHKPALETFTGLRDALTEEMKNGDRSRENQIDWLVLNIRLLKDDQTVAEWVDHIQDRDDGIDTMREMGSLMQDWATGSLLAHTGRAEEIPSSLRSATVCQPRRVILERS
jgi:hypothetical protein